MNNMNNMKIVLASASPRRSELLRRIVWEFTVKVSDVEEKITKERPQDVVEELSARKAEAVLRALTVPSQAVCAMPEAEADEQVPAEELAETDRQRAAEAEDKLLVIGADTVVACDGQILGKPHSEEEAMEMLRMLQGRSHYVYTGVTLCRRTGNVSFHEETKVTFYPMSEAEIREYVGSGDPMDKAGSYGIQGFCARYIRGIEGDYNNVVGLPVGRLYQEVRKLYGKKAVVFDLDGTLSDSLASIKYCGDKTMEAFGMGPFTSDQYKYFVGDGAANLVKRCLAAGGDEELAHYGKAYALYREIFRENCMYEVKPYEGIRELLDALKEKKMKIAVLSNKPHQETVNVIETLFGKGYFDVIQGQKPDVAIKPSPEGVFQILEQLHMTVEDILYLGDTCTDMQTGKGAGAFTVGALWGFRDRRELEDNHADAVIAHPLQLLDYI